MSRSNSKKVLFVIPTDSIWVYINKGIGDKLKDYFNPGGFFDCVYYLSPFDWSSGEFYQINVIPCHSKEQLNKFIRALKPSAIRVYGGGYGVELVANADTGDIPLLLSLHDVHPQMQRGELSKFNALIAVSESVAQDIAAYGIPRSKIFLLPNRVSAERFRSRAPKEWSTKTHQILHIGRKTFQKNLDNVIKALSKLPDSYTLLAIGAGDELIYKDLANDLGVRDRVVFIQSALNHELIKHMDQSLCLCNPSRWEGFGIVYIEAMAAGLPVITGGSGVGSEIFVDRLSGLLISDVENAAEIAQAIEMLAVNNILRNKIIDAGVLASKKYEKNRIDMIERKIYEKIVA